MGSAPLRDRLEVIVQTIGAMTLDKFMVVIRAILTLAHARILRDPTTAAETNIMLFHKNSTYN